jgi:hypothetical protein
VSQSLHQSQKPNKFLVYINGVRVPAYSCSVSSGIFSPVSATIDVPPHRLLSRIGADDRLQVAVFYLDCWYYADDPQWALLFEGEVVGFSYTNQGSSRALSLSVASHLTLLTQLFFFFLSGKASSKSSMAKPDREFPNQLNIKSKFPGTFFTQGVHNKQPIARPFDIVENIIAAVTGEYKESVPSVSVSEKDIKEEVDRLKSLWNLQVASDIDRLVEEQARKELEGDTVTVEALSRKKEELRESVTLTVEKRNRDALVGVVQSYAVKASDKNISNKTSVELQTHAFRLQAAKTLQYRSATSKSITHTGFYARHMRLTRFLEHWVASPYVEGRPGQEDPVNGKLGGGVFPLLKAVNAKRLIKALVNQSGARFGENSSLWGFLTTLFSNLYYEIVEVMAPPSHTLDKYGLPYGPFRDAGASSDSPESWAATLSSGKRRLGIGSFLTKPQTTFSLPPACNAIFPSMWSSLQLSEDYSRTPTRAYFSKSSAINKLTSGSKLSGYSANSTRVGFPATVDGHMDRASSTGTSDTEFLIFPEEYYAGPKPMIRQLPDMFTELNKVANSRRFGLEKEDLEIQRKAGELYRKAPIQSDMVSKDIRASENRKAQGHSTHALLYMLAEHEFYKQKYTARQGQVSGSFNPYVVTGFPIAVFDNNSSGMHLLAVAQQVRHNLTDKGFYTSVDFTFARTFEDMMATMKADGGYLDAGPHDPIGELQDLFQYIPAANMYYSVLFRRAEVPAMSEKGKGSNNLGLVPLDALISANVQGSGVMDYRTLLQWDRPSSESQAIVTRPLTAEERSLPAFEDLPTGTGPAIYTNTPLKPKSEVKELFDSNDLAMDYVSRPVCTLEDYIDFYAVAGRGAYNLDPVGRGRGIRVGPSDQNKTVPTYYSVIRQFIGGPGTEPGSKIASTTDTGAKQESLRIRVIGSDGELQEAVIVPAGDIATFADLPDSIKDWQSLLLDYTAEIESLSPQGSHSSDPEVLTRRAGS